MKLLMHTCCAPCSVYCIESLRSEGIEPVLYWYNPNIHPYIEYKTRRDTLIEYSKLINLKLIINENYGLKEFCKNVVNDLDNRCINYCYRVRLEETAKFAKIESDLAAGKDGTIEEYIQIGQTNYSNAVSKTGYKIGTLIEKFMNTGIQKVLKVLEKLF